MAASRAAMRATPAAERLARGAERLVGPAHPGVGGRLLRVLVQPIVETANGEVRLFAVECLTRGPRGTRITNYRRRRPRRHDVRPMRFVGRAFRDPAAQRGG